MRGRGEGRESERDGEWRKSEGGREVGRVRRREGRERVGVRE